MMRKETFVFVGLLVMLWGCKPEVPAIVYPIDQLPKADANNYAMGSLNGEPWESEFAPGFFFITNSPNNFGIKLLGVFPFTVPWIFDYVFLDDLPISNEGDTLYFQESLNMEGMPSAKYYILEDDLVLGDYEIDESENNWIVYHKEGESLVGSCQVRLYKNFSAESTPDTLDIQVSEFRVDYPSP